MLSSQGWGCLFKFVFLSGLLLPAVACTGPGFDTTAGTVANSLQINSSIEAVNVFLSTGKCSNAISTIYPLYNSINSNNSIRFATASAYGCSAHINLLNNINGLLTFQSDSVLGLLFEFAANQFPSVANPDDKIPQAAENGTDAVQAIIQSGTVLVTAYTVNSTSNNPISLLSGDRLNDANSYLTFLSLALMGSLENRYATPSASNFYHKSNNLPWTTAATAIGDGCAYASAVLNYFDGIDFVQSVAPPSVASIYSNIQALEPQLNYGCCLGLQTCGFAGSCGASIPCNLTGGTCSTCTSCANCPSLCLKCPTTLRSRASCTGLVTDQNSCAAAGLVSQINDVLWSGPP